MVPIKARKKVALSRIAKKEEEEKARYIEYPGNSPGVSELRLSKLSPPLSLTVKVTTNIMARSFSNIGGIV